MDLRQVRKAAVEMVKSADAGLLDQSNIYSDLLDAGVKPKSVAQLSRIGVPSLEEDFDMDVADLLTAIGDYEPRWYNPPKAPELAYLEAHIRQAAKNKEKELVEAGIPKGLANLAVEHPDIADYDEMIRRVEGGEDLSDIELDLESRRSLLSSGALGVGVGPPMVSIPMLLGTALATGALGKGRTSKKQDQLLKQYIQSL